MNQQLVHSPINSNTKVTVSKGFTLSTFEYMYGEDKNAFKRLKRHILKKLLNTLPQNQKKLVLNNTSVDEFVDHTSLKSLEKLVNFSTYMGGELLDISVSLKNIPRRVKNEVIIKEFNQYGF